MQIKYLDIVEVYFIHEKMLETGGGRSGIRDFTLIHSAVERPKASFGEKMLYSNIWSQAAALIQSLIKNHAFNDGNKRTGFFSTLRFLNINNYNIKATKQEIIEFTIKIDVNNLNIETIAHWLKFHSKKIRQ